MSTKVYIGNLRPHVDKDTLEGLFTLCGPIENTEVIKYVDRVFGNRVYGFITFKSNESALRACYFDKRPYEGLVLIVEMAEKHRYGVFLGGIPTHFTDNDIKNFLRRNFEDKFYNNVTYTQGSRHTYINFKDEESRQKFLKMDNPFSSQFNIKEYKQVLASRQDGEQTVAVTVFKIPEGIQSSDIRNLFQLCGLSDRDPLKVINSENSYTRAWLKMSSSGYELAKKFDNCLVKNWPVPIRVVLNVQYDSEMKSEYRYPLTMRNFDPNWELKRFEADFFESFGLDSVRINRYLKDTTLLYINFKNEEDMEHTLAVSGLKWFGGAGPATFVKRMKRANSKESLASVGESNYHCSPERSPSPTQSVRSRPDVPWEITLKMGRKVIPFAQLAGFFGKIGKVDGLHRGPNNSFIIRLDPQL